MKIMEMQYTILAEQPYMQVPATEEPRTKEAKIAEYDAAEVGSYLHWRDSWKEHAGTVQWVSDWTPMEFRPDGRERLVVVAIPEQVNAYGNASHGGLFLLNIQRYRHEYWGEEYDIKRVASTGIRYRRPVEAFIAAMVRQHEAEQTFDRAIAEQSSEENDW